MFFVVQFTAIVTSGLTAEHSSW